MADPQLTPEQIAKATIEYQKQRDILESLSDQFDGIEKNLTNLASEAVKFAKANKDNVRQISELKGIYNDLSKTARTLSSLTEEYSSGLLKTKDITKTLTSLANTENRITQQLKQATEDRNSKLFGILQLQLQELENERKIAEKLEKENKEIDKKVGLTGKLLKTLSKIPILSDALDFELLNQKMRLAALDGKKVFKEVATEIQKQLKESIQDPLVGFIIGLALIKSGINDIKRAFSIFTEIDTTVTETSRTLGVTNDQVYEMNRAAKQVSDNQLNTLYTTKQTSQAISDINTQLGLSVDLGGETINEFAAMTNQMGLSAAEASSIYKLGKLTNLSLKDTNKAISAQIVAVQKSTGIQINARQVFQEIGKLNAGITTKFQQNPELIAKAVAQAKALGTNLETIDKIAESLLNFETSIENELKAELITGRQLNFERARAAALTGDQATLMQEVALQVGSLAEFQGMNVIAQRSLAEAFGMTRDDMADMLQKQELFTKLGDVSGKSAAEQLEIARQRGLSESDSLVVNLKQQAASEKIAAAFDSIKLAVADLLAGPFSGLVDAMSSLAKNAGLIKTAIGFLAVVSLAKTIGGLAIMAVQLGIMSAGAAAYAAGITLGLGAIAVIAALNSMSSANEEAKQKATQNVPQYALGGIITQPHIGMVGEAGPEAIIPLNSSKAAGILGSDLSSLINAINEVKAVINTMANKPTPPIALMVAGEKLGEVVGRQSETGTNQYQNAYRLA